MLKRTPDLLKDWKLYYQRVRSIVLLMKERRIFFGSTKVSTKYLVRVVCRFSFAAYVGAGNMWSGFLVKNKTWHCE